MVVRTREKRKGAALVLGFNRHTNTDVYRIETLSRMWEIFTISRTEELGREDHLTAHFNDIGGRNSAILAVVRKARLLHPIVDAFLDYWWVANGYFADAYRLKWLSHWVKLILEAGARYVILPYNMEVEGMEMEPNALVGEHIAKEESALWLATHNTKLIPKKFHKQKMRGLNGKTPFIRFGRAGHEHIYMCLYCSKKTYKTQKHSVRYIF